MIEVVLNSIVLAFALVLLAMASRFAIKSIEDLIKLTRLSEASVGFAILSVMTSIPEICVAFFSVLQGKPGFSVGDVLGSNVFNIGIVVGILATIGSLSNLLFERTGFPDMLLLIVLGALLGPVLGLFEPSSIMSLAPYLAALALVFIFQQQPRRFF